MGRIGAVNSHISISLPSITEKHPHLSSLKSSCEEHLAQIKQQFHPSVLKNKTVEPIGSLKEAKQTVYNMIREFEHENGSSEQSQTFLGEVKKVFSEIKQKILNRHSAALTKTSWQVERFEATFHSLKNIIHVFVSNDPSYQSLLQFLDNPLEKSSFEGQLKTLLDNILADPRSDADRFDDEDYFNSLFYKYHQDFFDSLRELLASSAYQEYIQTPHDEEVLASLNYAQSSYEVQQQIICRFLRQFSGALYLGIDLEPTNFRLVKNMVNYGAQQTSVDTDFDDLTSAPLSEYFSRGLPQMHACMSAVPNSITGGILSHACQGIRSYFNCFFSPNVQNNPIQQMGAVKVIKNSGEKKEIFNLAFGSQTQEFCCLQQAQIAPEFSEGFLEEYRQRGFKHLYIMYQNMIPPLKIATKSSNCFYELCLRVVDAIIQFILKVPLLNLPLLLLQILLPNESKRGDALVQLSSQERMQDTLYLLALSKDSPFYHQSGSYYSSMDRFEDFKEEILRQFFEMDRHSSGIYIGPNLVNLFGGPEQFRVDFLEIVNGIHEQLFYSKKRLSINERKSFIVILYTNLTRHLLVNPNGKCHIDSFNTSCLADIDRGMAMEALLETDIHLKSDHQEESVDETTFKKEIAKTFFSRAMLVASRPIHENRFQRALQAIHILCQDHLGVKTLDSRLMQGNRIFLSLN